MLLNKDQILQAQDLPFEDVETPEWGGAVRVRTMTAAEKDQYDADVWDLEGEKVVMKRDNSSAKLLARCIVGEDGKRLFSEKEIALLGGKSTKAINRLSDVARNLNGLNREVQKEAEKK